MDITWYRIQHIWSYGFSGWEESHEIGEYTLAELDELLDEDNPNHWSEQYRGFTVEILKAPSPEYLENLKQYTINTIKHKTELLDRLNNIRLDL
jgi:hypothetical protein